MGYAFRHGLPNTHSALEYFALTIIKNFFDTEYALYGGVFLIIKGINTFCIRVSWGYTTAFGVLLGSTQVQWGEGRVFIVSFSLLRSKSVLDRKYGGYKFFIGSFERSKLTIFVKPVILVLFTENWIECANFSAWLMVRRNFCQV